MSPFGRRLLAAVIGFALQSIASALTWQTQEVSVATAPFQTELDVIFTFNNDGPRPVTIREIETSCSCLQAKADQKIYSPGAKGTIAARFTVGDREGLYERIVTVLTDEPGETARLTLKIQVPAVATVTPRSTAWLRHDAPVEKTFELVANGGLEIDFTGTEITSNRFLVRLESMERGRKYRLHIRPDRTDEPASAAVRITGREKSGHEVLLSAYVSIN